MKKNIVITAGPTNEQLDAVMQITNMSTGSLGVKIADALLNNYADQIDTVYYLSPKLARKPEPRPQIRYIPVSDTQSLLDALQGLLTDPDKHIDAVVHSAAVGDYKGRYAARAEDVAAQIADSMVDLAGLNNEDCREAVLEILAHPACVQDSSTKISSYEPNLMVMLDLTPKVIGHIKTWSPGTMLIGFKLLEGVTNDELLRVASRLRDKNGADYIMANDLARIGAGRHWGMIVSENGVLTECNTKDEIALNLARLVFNEKIGCSCYSEAGE